MGDIDKLETKFDTLDSRMRNVENLLGRIEITLDVLTKLHQRMDNIELQLNQDRRAHNELALVVNQNALIVNALKWTAAAIVPLALSVLGTIVVSWLRMEGAA